MAPQGIKRVGAACKIPSSDGCTSMDNMSTSILYKGTFGGTKWAAFPKAQVLFTEKHWMTSSVLILYLQYLRRLCPGIGLVVLDWIDNPEIIYDFIEAGMTSVYQTPDVGHKQAAEGCLEKAYGKHRNEIADLSRVSN